MTNLPTFIHIPRTGGTVIAKALGYPPNREQHKPWWAYEKLDRPWTIVRCPFDRAVSLCAFLLRHGLRKGEVLAREEFEAWLRSGMRDGYGRTPILYPETLYPMHVCAPQAAFCGIRIQYTPFRRLEELWPWILNQFDESMPPYPKRDSTYASARRETAYYYTDKTAAMVRKIYAVDFEIFGFSEEVK